MMRILSTRSARLLAFTAAFAAGCADNSTPTAPSATKTAPTNAAFAKGRPRTPYIADMQLSSIYINMSGGFTPFTVTVRNPTSKDVQGIHLKGELKSQNNMPPTTATAFIANCPVANGVVPRGDCTMSNGISGGVGLSPGAGTFTLRVLQEQPDGTMLVLDTRTVDVVLGQSY
jgi:hypothetical protein